MNIISLFLLPIHNYTMLSNSTEEIVKQIIVNQSNNNEKSDKMKANFTFVH